MEYVRYALERISVKFPLLDYGNGGNNGCKIAFKERKARGACHSVQRFAAWFCEKYRRTVQQEELLFCTDASG